MLLTGQYEHSIDAKHRLAVPADIRSAWRPERDGSAWYAVPWPDRTIRLYTEATFLALAASRRVTLTPDPAQADLQRALFGFTRRLEVDAAGRIRLPEDLLALTGLSGEVALVGMGEFLEIRDRADWKRTQADLFKALPELIRRTNSREPGED